jgi:hypothetical protein
MANSNCLKGMACPRCGSDEPFEISVRTTSQLWDAALVKRAICSGMKRPIAGVSSAGMPGTWSAFMPARQGLARNR